MRRPAARVKPRTARNASFPAPVGGWIKNLNLATPDARLPDGSKVQGAFVLDNMFPTATGIRMRGGTDVYSLLDDQTIPVLSLFTYINGNNEKLFAANAHSIFDITTPLIATTLVDQSGNVLVTEDGDALVLQATYTPAVAGLTGGVWCSVQFATPGGVFLRLVNGVDTPLVYDGLAFSTTPAITGVDPTTLSYVWVHQRRLFFIKKDSLSAFYLPSDAVGGAAVEFPLGAVFTRGGSLLFGSAWSIESGNGLVEQCIFVSTEGEVAIYQGSDPSVASSWSKVGVYRIGRPLGAKGHIRAGGDIIIATDIGFVPLSQAIQRDVSALSPSAISYRIETAWNDAVAERSLGSWSCEVWPTKQMVLVSLPTVDGTPAQMFAANARTGAWGLFTGWNGTCLQQFKDRLFFGSVQGKVIEAEVTGLDEGKPYTAACVPLFDALKAPASIKTSLLMRAVVRASAEVVPKISLQSDYRVALPSPPDDTTPSRADVWGAGIWGVAQWGVARVKDVFQRWQSVGGSGYALAPGVQITSGSIVPPDVELVRVDMTYEQGDIVT